MSFKCNYILSTGNSDIVGSRGFLKVKNKKTSSIEGSAIVQSNISTGHFSLDLSLDGLTFFEEYPIETTINGVDFFNIESGDFYMLKDQYDENIVYFSQLIEDGSEFIYDQKDIDSGVFAIKEDTGVGTWEGSTISELTGQISEFPPLDINDFFDRWKVFFNKKKINIEDSTAIDNITGFSFAYKKEDGLTEIRTNNFDVYGTGVLPKQSDLYIDGLKKDRDLFLEINTGITMIKLGVESKRNFQEQIETNFSL